MSMDDDKTRILPDMARTGVGTQLSGIYELDERIASGGMGEVYRGHNIQTGDHVAIKIVLPEFARDQTILSLFRKEASILNHLSHDAIVRYHVFTIDPGIGRPYLAMEFVNGESLFDVMRRGAMATRDVRKLCHRLASGLSAVHEAGAVHRDLSPDNVILPGGKVERAKIIDFGIARSATVGGETLIGGRFAGKYNYVSPEQLGLFGGEVSELSDIYSLGLVLAAVLRGKPVDMSGSQYEIVEKRRVVPDLDGIDGEFLPIIQAMLQPDPRDRPTSAELARMTRDEAPADAEGTLAPRAATLRDRTAPPPHLPKAAALDAWTAAPQGPATAAALTPVPPAKTDEPGFVPHMRPAHLSRPPVAAAPFPRPPAAKAPPPSTGRRNMAIAAVTALVVISAAGAYLGGFLSFQSGIADSPTPRLSPGQSKPPPAEDAAGGQGSAGEAAQQQPAEKPTAPAGANPATRPQAAPPKQPEIVTEQAKPSTKPAEVASSAPPATNTARPATRPDVAKDGDRDATSSSGAKPATSQASPPPKQPARVAVTQPAAQGTTPPASQFPKSDAIAAPPADGGGDGDATKQAPAANTSPASNAADIAKALSQQFDEQQGNAPGGTDVAINLPRPKVPPSLPPPASNRIAERISWLRAYQGGDCFYATATSMTDKAAEIEGFGTAAEPFVRMMGAFQARFDIEPDISVRLIDPAQCEVTHFLGVLGAPAPEKPKLTLDHTSVPSGSPISGTLETQGGLRTSLLLIDHKGMAFSLDDRVVVQGGKATFNVPIGLAAADRAAGKAVPQIIIAVTGASDIEAATFANAMPASTLLPRILAEISKKPTAFSATAKYFQLGN